MNLIRLVGRALPASLKQRFKEDVMRRLSVPDMAWRMENMRRIGFNPGAIIDVGAFKGEWTRMAHQIFPTARILMLEAQESKRPILEEVRRDIPGLADFRIMLLGPENKDDALFNYYAVSPTASSVLPDTKGSPAQVIKCQMRTLDFLAREAGFAAPNFMKLDVQGYELEVLKGGTAALQSAEAVLMEVSLIELYENSPLLHDVTAFMHQHGFVTYDICSLIQRPLDLAVCQVDMIFVKPHSPLLKSKVWGD